MPDAAPRPSRAYRTFGWQGINLTVPADWDLRTKQGNYQAGRVRLADEHAVRLELRWQAARSSGHPGDTVSAYLASLDKAARKRGQRLSVQRGLKLGSPPGVEAECYRWAAEGQGVAMLSRCDRCGRLVHVQLTGARDEPLRGLARTVFASLKDHPADGGHLWSFFDVQFTSPRGLPLTSSDLRTGCIRMGFSRGLTKVEFVRLSLAATLLAGKGLDRWFREFYQKPLKRRSFRTRPCPVRAHDGIAVEGAPWLICNPLRLVGRRRLLRAACWHCDRTNRIFICCYDGPAAGADGFERAVEGFICCEAA
jgi:hypothetical protein